MEIKTPISPVRRKRSGGQAIIENALTLVPMLSLILGMTDFGLMIFRWTTLQNAVREGTRYAVTYQLDTSGHQDTSIENQVTFFGMGLVKTTDNPQTIFVNYFDPVSFSADTNKPGNVVQVSIQNVKFNWISILNGTWWSTSNARQLGISVYSSDILGGYPVGVTSIAR